MKNVKPGKEFNSHFALCALQFAIAALFFFMSPVGAQEQTGHQPGRTPPVVVLSPDNVLLIGVRPAVA